jgi:hypothetical protein
MELYDWTTDELLIDNSEINEEEEWPYDSIRSKNLR